ncbi:hypothetical protein HHK36_005778 [Tetracentron sinense]|uniref:FAS1 domain-containing protein n=1 Tax=Tetracentron sinense TaxID=13715 RepID=A0A835DQZ0_TETSI|nr:hypothetical protein HHK36_005778 [Tetracentron sinense]
MGFWFFIILALFTLTESQPTAPLNQTDLQAAIADMRTKSYHGFVILLKMLNSTHNSLLGRDVTFLMPSDQELSGSTITQENLQDFLLSHSIPTALLFNNLLHFPTGTLVPSSLPNRMISVANHGRTSFFLNNARLVNPEVCLSSLIRCHGISATITFNKNMNVSLPAALPAPLRIPALRGSSGHNKQAKSSIGHMRTPTPTPQ